MSDDETAAPAAHVAPTAPAAPTAPTVPAVRRAGGVAPGELSAALHAIGAMVGIPVTVTDLDEWQLDARGLRVGLGWYLRRGHSEREAVALAMLQLWEGPRDPLRAPDRARRRQTLERSRPELAPLLGAVHRAQATAELLAVMPGLRIPLRAALFRLLPRELSTLPRHLQWASLVLASTLPGSQAQAPPQTTPPQPAAPPLLARIEDRAVAREWRAMRVLGGEEVDALQRVLAPHPGVAPLRRLERALALLLPGYERLLALDLAEQRATTLGTDNLAPGTADEDSPAADETGAADSADPADRTDPADPDCDNRTADDPEASTAPDPRQRFQAMRDRFTRNVLATPIPDALSQAVLARAAEAAPAEPGEPGGGSGEAVLGTILADYRASAARLAAAIDATRALWARILADRIAPRRVQSRRALPEGDELADEQLARTVADTLAGVRDPAAFRRREARPRLTRSVGSTDYVLMVDRSASMTGAGSAAAADAALVMIEALAAVERDIIHAERAAGVDLELDIRSCLIVFGAEAVVLKPLSHGLDDAVRRRMHAEVRAPSGSTNDAAALRAAAEQLGIPGGGVAADGLPRRRVAILVGDGGTNDALAAADELQRLRAAGVRVHAVGIGTEDLAARYAPHGVSIAEAGQLPSALAGIIEHGLP